MVQESKKMLTVVAPSTLGILQTSKELLVQVSTGSSIQLEMPREMTS